MAEQAPSITKKIHTGRLTDDQLVEGGISPFATAKLVESFKSGPYAAGYASLSFIYQSELPDAKPFRVTVEEV